MNSQLTTGEAHRSFAPRHYELPIVEGVSTPHPDAEGITDELIRAVVTEFYRRARRDDHLGPVFEKYVQDWETHLTKMTDFWSAALLRTGRYSGRPIEQHRAIDGLSASHFSRWLELFEATVHDLCDPQEARAFLIRAQRMRDGITKVLGLPPSGAPSPP